MVRLKRLPPKLLTQLPTPSQQLVQLQSLPLLPLNLQQNLRRKNKQQRKL